MTQYDDHPICIGHTNDTSAGTRFVIRRHTWGFSETLLRHNGSRWETVEHREYGFGIDLYEIPQ